MRRLGGKNDEKAERNPFLLIFFKNFKKTVFFFVLLLYNNYVQTGNVL
jgi:hypothetical protein